MENDLHLDHHISHKFNEELEALRRQELQMGALVEERCRGALQALSKGNEDLGRKVAGGDADVNAMELSISAACTDILARRQPAASDLRLVVSVIRMIADLERIGDEAAKIGRFAAKLAAAGVKKDLSSEPKPVGKSVIAMLHDALDAFARLDMEAAISVAERDREVEEQLSSLNRVLVTHMMEQPRIVKPALQVNLCARALERIGDHAVNICEEVVFLVKGSDVRHLTVEEIRERFPPGT